MAKKSQVQILRRGTRTDPEVVAQARAQRLVDEERFRAVAFAVESVHQDAVSGFAIRLELDEGASGADRGRELGSTDAECCAGVRLERAHVQRRKQAALVVDPARFLARQERPAGDEQRDLRRAPRAMRIALRERRLGAVDGLRRRFDVDPLRDEPKALELDELPELREERREAAVAPVGPERTDRLVARDGAKAVHREECEQQPALAARYEVVDAPLVDPDDEPAAQLHPCVPQAAAKIVPTPTAYNAGIQRRRQEMAIATFDPGAYKETTRVQWDEAAAAWHRWGPFLERWLGEATDRMLDDVRADGARVLDLAAGAGGQTIAAAKRATAVLATDISERILEFAANEARTAGLANVATRTMDGEHLDVEDGSFDAAISRLGLMYMPDKQAALAEVRRALRPGGRYGAIVFAEADRNPFFSIPIGIIRKRAQLPPPAPGLPGPFSCASLGEQLEAAGFREVEVRRVAAPVELASAAECTQLERESFGALHQMLAGLPEAEREETWAAIEAALREFEGPNGFSGPCELLVGSGAN